jgi:hypothetical protein
MADFNVRSDSVNVEQIMEQIRSRIREKRGIDYTEEQIRELASVKLEKFLDSRGLRSELLEEFRRAHGPYQPPELPNYSFEDHTLFDSTRAPLRWIRRLLLPILKLFFNPNKLIAALHIQSRLNAMSAEREARREATRHGLDQLHYELLHNLVVETTRMSIDVRNLQMRVESLTSRLEFNERRARALESVVVYQSPTEVADAAVRQDVAPAGHPTDAERSGRPQEGPGQRSRRRRRRRGRRGGGAVAGMMGGQPPASQAGPAGAPSDDTPASERGAPDSDDRSASPEPLPHPAEGGPPDSPSSEQ